MGQAEIADLFASPPAAAGEQARSAAPWPLDLRHLKVLCEIAHRGSFSAAADALNFTPSAISQQMGKLQRDVGVALFERHARGVVLTPGGEALFHHAEAVLKRLADAAAELEDLATGRRGRLRLGSFATGTATFGAAAMELFRARFPGVSLDLKDGEPYESATRLKHRELDLAVLFELDRRSAWEDDEGDWSCTTSELECFELFDDPFLLVMRRDHPLAGCETVTLAELAGERILGRRSRSAPWGADFWEACRAAGVQPTVEDSYRCTDFLALQAIVATGRALSLVPRLALPYLRSDLCARPLEHAPVAHVRAARLAEADPSVLSEGMLEILREATAHLRGSPVAAVDLCASPST